MEDGYNVKRRISKTEACEDRPIQYDCTSKVQKKLPDIDYEFERYDRNNGRFESLIEHLYGKVHRIMGSENPCCANEGESGPNTQLARQLNDLNHGYRALLDKLEDVIDRIDL